MASACIRKTPTGRYMVWWRLDDGSQGSQTFGTRDAARDFKNDLLARLAPRGVERPGEMVRFARLMQRRGRVLGGPAVRAASDGNHTPTASLPSVVDQKQEQSEPAGGPVADRGRRR